MSKQSPERLPNIPYKSPRLYDMLNLTPFPTPEWSTDAFIKLSLNMLHFEPM